MKIFNEEDLAAKLDEYERVLAAHDTFPKLLAYQSKRFGNTGVALRHKKFGIWQRITWQEYYDKVKYLSLGLLSLGFKLGDKVAIIGDNAPEWNYAELAVQSCHGAVVGMYSDLLPAEIAYIIEDSDCKFAIAEGQEQVDKFLEIKDKLPLLKKVIYWDSKGLTHYDDPMLISLGELEKPGRAYEEEYPGTFEQNVQTGKGDQIAALVYTSGTTALPKGSIHSYRSLQASVLPRQRLEPNYETDNLISALPPAWIAGQWMFGTPLLIGCTVNFPEKVDTTQQDAREIGPATVLHPGRLWEQQAAMIQAKILDTLPVKRLAYNLFLPIGYKLADLKVERKKVSLFWSILYAIANVCLFRPLRDQLGLPNVRNAGTGGALLSPDAFRYFLALGIPIKQSYGSTEGGSLTALEHDEISFESCGKPLRGVEIRITDEGEIINRGGGVFLAYHKRPEETDKVLKNGWFYSGDAGYIGDDGYLIYLDRVKDLVTLATGDRIAPQYIESRLKFSPYIRDAWAVAGEDKPFASLVIIIDYENVGRWAERRKIAYTTFTDLSQKPEVYDLIKADIARINKSLPSGGRVKKFINLHKEFDPDEAELTRTRKLRRGALEQRYAEVVEAIYSNKTELSVEASVTYKDGRKATVKSMINVKTVED